MKQLLYIILIIGFIFQVFFGCVKDSQQEQLQVAVEADDTVKAEIEDLIKENPKVTVSEGGIEYYIKIVEPDPNKIYSILLVEPDPKIDYKIIIVDPNTRQPTTKIDPIAAKAIGEEIYRRKLKRKEK